MGTRGQIIFGLFLVFLGLIYILGIVFNIDTGALCWPILLIVLGVWLLARPKLERSGSNVILIGDFKRRGQWNITSTDIWIGIGDVRLDFTESELPLGESVFRVNGLIGNFTAEVVPGTAVMVNASAFVTDTNIFGKKTDNILTPVRYRSEGYDAAERKLRFDITHFVGDIKVKQP
jgi:lia operon protein LiaF